MNAYIKTNNLKVGYGKKVVVDNVNISIDQGEIYTIIGPNGSGKSTMLKTIAKQLDALDGHICIDQVELRNKTPQELAKEMAVCFTGESVKERITCCDVVSLGRYPYTGLLGKLSENDIKIIDEVMDEVGISDLRNEYYNEISDGQRQRILLARALCQEPQILILDEPTTFLDIKFKLEFLNMLLTQVKNKNIAVIMSLHELDMARQISDQIICIKDHKVLKTGTPDEIFKEGFINELFDIKIGSYDEINARALLKG